MGRAAEPGEFVNWAGDQRCRPARVAAPRTREELAAAIGAAAAAGQKVSVAGSLHSFTEAALTDGTMVRLDALRRVTDADRGSGLVRVGGGTVLADLNEELAALGLALENLGDIDAQTVAGAISTGTHGTGAGFANISSRVEAVELVLGDDADLSAAHERDTAYIAVHQYRGMEWRPYFEAVEAIMDDYFGRPHWGKRHFQTAATLAPRYPRWSAFQAARDELDPARVFTNDYAERVLGP